MDELVKNVERIDVSLTRSEKTLALLKSNAKDEIGSDVKQIGTALKTSHQQIENVHGEIQALLEDVDKETEEEPLDLQPKMTWLRTNINGIVANLERAESMANSAMTGTMRFQSSISDIDQQIVVQRRELDSATRVGVSLKSKAYNSKQASLKLIRETEGEIAEKDREIRGKSSEASTLRSELSTQRSELETMNEKLVDAQARAREAKDKAWGSGLMAVGGLLMAPVTGGASLLLTAGAGAYSVDKAIKYDDLKIVMNKLRSDISGTEDKIRTVDRKIAELAAEKGMIERRLQRLKAALKDEEASRTRSQREIDRADKLASNISSLQWQAKTASNEARDSVRGLGNLKSNLNEAIGKIRSESNELMEESNSVPTGGGPKRHQRRNRAALVSVAEALKVAKSKIPATISTSGMRLLEGRMGPSGGGAHCFAPKVKEQEVKPAPVANARISRWTIDDIVTWVCIIGALIGWIFGV